MFKHTLITLIPKRKHSNNLVNFHLILLCTSFYKVVSKILSNKPKLTLPQLINPFYSAFIKGRDISDNIALTQEIYGELNFGIHGYAFCAMWDLKKAFDLINKYVIIERMTQVGYPTLFTDWLQTCIMDIPFSIIYNGATIMYSNSSNGL